MPGLSEAQRRRIRGVASYAPGYIDDLRARWDPATLTAHWWDALRFWFAHCFYQGRRDEVSALFERRALGVLEDVLDSSDLTSLRTLPDEALDEDGPLDRRLALADVPKRYDRLMVLSTLSVIAGLPDGNLVAHSLVRIRDGEMEDLFYELQRMKSVGEKIASFYLRDLDFLFGLAADIRPDGYVLMQPLDVWVRDVSLRLGIIPDNEASPGNRRSIVKACLEADVNPNCFNVGAWWAGKKHLPIPDGPVD